MKIKPVFILMILVLLGCEKQNRDIVATVGDRAITFQEFKNSFALFPQYQPNSSQKEARLQQIHFMAERILMAKAAEREKMDQWPETKARLEYIKRKETLQLLHKKEILDKIQLSDQEAWEEYRRSNIEVRLRHLFAETEEKAQQYYTRLQNGEPFEKLAREVFLDSTLAANGGDLGFVKLGDLDPFLVDSVYAQRLHRFSKPLKSSYGYHIVEVTDIKQSVFLSKSYFEERKENYFYSLKNRRALAKSEEYLKEVLKGKSVTIKTAVLNKLLEINRTEISAKRNELPIPTPRVSDRELTNVARAAADIFNQPLVLFNGKSWTVGEFLIRLKTMPPLHRPVVNKNQALVKSIIEMVRDELLLERARKLGLEQSPEVKEAVQKWREEVLADEFKRRIQLVEYKKNEPDKWARRKELLEQLRQEYVVKIDTTVLMKDLQPSQYDQKVPQVPVIIRDFYIW
ncbi:MAG: hypothetical protein Kow0037_02200 [Calditrichia bacterium]